MIIKHSKVKGFTLVEMMVSISIFVLVAFTVTSTLISVTNANRKAQELKQIIDNLNFSVQAMVLRMREGTDYTCTTYSGTPVANPTPGLNVACSSPGVGNAIAFHDPNGDPIKYYLGGDSIVKVDNPGGNGLPITSPEVTIESLEFRVGNVGGGVRPYVVISIKGNATLRSNNQKSEFQLQTFVSQHNQ